EVKASEDGQNFITLGNVTAQTDTLTISNLDHFTLFVVVGTISGTTASTFDESAASVVINEFMYNPSSGNEWVELYNKSSSSITLTNWTLVDSANNVKNLSGYIPVNGFYVYETNNWLNNTTGDGTGDTISLKNGSSLIDQIAYQKKTGQGTIVGAQSLGAAQPDGTQTIARTTDGGSNWAIVTPTKGWSNTLPAPTAVYIDSTYIGVNTGAINQPFTSIQPGINLVASGGTINVLDGTYQEQLVIRKNLTLKGNGAD